jgi:hypothetical protein
VSDFYRCAAGCGHFVLGHPSQASACPGCRRDSLTLEFHVESTVSPGPCPACGNHPANFQCLRCLDERCFWCFLFHTTGEASCSDLRPERAPDANEVERFSALGAVDRAWVAGRFTDEQRATAYATIMAAHGPLPSPPQG